MDLINHQQVTRQERCSHPGVARTEDRKKGLVDSSNGNRCRECPFWCGHRPGLPWVIGDRIVGVEHPRQGTNNLSFERRVMCGHKPTDARVKLGCSRSGRNCEIEPVDL